MHIANYSKLLKINALGVYNGRFWDTHLPINPIIYNSLLLRPKSSIIKLLFTIESKKI